MAVKNILNLMVKIRKMRVVLLKKLFFSIVIIVVVIFVSINLYTKFKLKIVREKVLHNHPEITEIVAVNSIGQWGEWFSEYTLVVELNGKMYRVWTYEDGKITDKELLN